MVDPGQDSVQPVVTEALELVNALVACMDKRQADDEVQWSHLKNLFTLHDVRTDEGLRGNSAQPSPAQPNRA